MIGITFPSFLDGMAAQVWQSTLLFVLVLALAWAARRSSARVRYVLWLLVLARLAIPPFEVEVRSRGPSIGSWLRHPLDPVLTLGSAAEGFETAGRPDRLDAGPHAESTLAAAGSKIPGDGLRHRTFSRGSRFCDGLFRLWLTGLAFGGGMLLVRARLQRRLLRFSRPAPAWITAEAEALRSRLGIRRPVSVVCADEPPSPATVGFLRPLVILPTRALSCLSPRDLSIVLAHELHHVRSWDLLFHWLSIGVRIAYFFHPVAWWSCRHLRLERELAADEAALRHSRAAPRVYGDILLRVAALSGAWTQRAAVSLGLSEAARDLRARLLRLPLASTLRSRWAHTVPAMAVLIILVAVPRFAAAPAAPGRGPHSDGEEFVDGGDGVLASFARALEAGDVDDLERFLQFESKTDEQLFQRILEAAAETAPADSNRTNKVVLIASERLADDYLYACFAADLPALWAEAAMPLNLVFHREDQRWRTPWFASARTIWDAQHLTPTGMGQRSIRKHLVAQRFGEIPRDVWIAMQEARSRAFASDDAAKHGFPQPMIDAFADPARREQLNYLRGLDWPEVEKLLFSELDEDSFARAEEFEIAFFLEADGQTLRPLALAGDSGGALRVERYPCLCETEVTSARREATTPGAPPVVALDLTRLGRRVLAQVAAQHADRRWVVTSRGKVIAVLPVADIPGDRPVVVRGSWTEDEAERVIGELNAHHEGIGNLIRERLSGADPSPPVGVSKAVSVPARTE